MLWPCRERERGRGAVEEKWAGRKPPFPWAWFHKSRSPNFGEHSLRESQAGGGGVAISTSYSEAALLPVVTAVKCKGPCCGHQEA